MIAFAIIGLDGLPTGGGIGRELPPGAVALTSPYTTLDLRRLRYVDGSWQERTDLPVVAPPTAEERAAFAAGQLTRAIGMAIDRINRVVGQFRARFETDIPGQAELYADKRREALAYLREVELSGPPATLTAYELIADEMGITAPTALQIAELWLARSNAAKTAARRSERLRQATVQAISTAPDTGAIETIEADFNRALNGLSI